MKSPEARLRIRQCKDLGVVGIGFHAVGARGLPAEVLAVDTVANPKRRLLLAFGKAGRISKYFLKPSPVLSDSVAMTVISTLLNPIGKTNYC